MTRVFLLAKLSAASQQAREEILAQLSAAADTTKTTDPNTTKYAICIPRDATDDKTVCMIREYTNKEAMLKRAESTPVKKVVQHLFSNDLITGPPDLKILSYIDDSFIFTKASISTLSDPHISFATINFQPGKLQEALPAWKAVHKETETESGSYMYGLMVDTDGDGEQDRDALYTIQAYESEKYLREVHLKGEAVKETWKTLEMTRGGLKGGGVVHLVLKIVGGYLVR